MAPSVIYIDEVDRVFGKKKKAAASASGEAEESPSRIKKFLEKVCGWFVGGRRPVADQCRRAQEMGALAPEDNVLVIGCTSNAEGADADALMSLFQKHVFFPAPSYQARQARGRAEL
jgi:SpoVK/Ycf46/Vps4 family AAA+-type ATPase